MMGPYGDVTVQLPTGWYLVDAGDVPSTILPPNQTLVRLLAARALPQPGYAPNLVVVKAPVAPGQDPDEAVVASAQVMRDTIPGLFLLEDMPVVGSRPGERLRCGVYILDEESLTLTQVTWPETRPDGAAVWSATVTCRTRDMDATINDAYALITTVETAR